MSGDRVDGYSMQLCEADIEEDSEMAIGVVHAGLYAVHPPLPPTPHHRYTAKLTLYHRARTI